MDTPVATDDGAIQLAGVTLRERSAEVRPDTTLDQLETAIQEVGRAVHASHWWYGDLYLAAEDFGELRWQIMPENPHLSRTIRRDARVCQAFPPEARVWDLSFSHYLEVYKDTADLRQKCLDTAERDCFTTKELRQYRRELLGRDDGDPDPDVLAPPSDLPPVEQIAWKSVSTAIRKLHITLETDEITMIARSVVEALEESVSLGEADSVLWARRLAERPVPGEVPNEENDLRRVS